MVLVHLTLFTYLLQVRLVSKVNMGIAVAAAIVLRQQSSSNFYNITAMTSCIVQ